MNALLIIFLCIFSFAFGVVFMAALFVHKFPDASVKDVKNLVKRVVTPDYRTPEEAETYPDLIDGIRERKQVQELKEKISTLEEELNGYKSAGRDLELLDQVSATQKKLYLAGFGTSNESYKEARRLHGFK